jgi:amidase
VDVVLLPVLSMETPSWDELAALGKDVFNFVRFNMPINAAGAPAVALPCGFTAAGRPLGMQLVGPHCSEATLLRAAHAYQQMSDWHLRRPP